MWPLYYLLLLIEVSDKNSKLLEGDLCGFNITNKNKPRFLVYVCLSTRASSNCEQQCFFFFQGNYYFASNITPVFERYPSCGDLNGSIFKYKLGQFKSYTIKLLNVPPVDNLNSAYLFSN